MIFSVDSARPLECIAGRQQGNLVNATEVEFLLGQILVRDLQQSGSNLRRDGRVAEGGGLLNRYRVKSSIGGSNPPLSAIDSSGLLPIA